MSTWKYIGVNTNKQNTENQKLAVLKYANKNYLTINHWIEKSIIRFGTLQSFCRETVISLMLMKKRKGAHSSRIVKQAGSLGELVRRTYDI